MLIIFQEQCVLKLFIPLIGQQIKQSGSASITTKSEFFLTEKLFIRQFKIYNIILINIINI